MSTATRKKPTKSVKKPSATDRVELVVLLDRSGSMSSIKTDMEGGFNRFIEEQRKAPGDLAVTLVQFDTQGIEAVYEAKPVKDVGPLVLVPRGGTPLLDATGQTITRTRDRISAANGNKPDRVVFLIITDGEENSSHEFKKDQIKKLVADQTGAGWAFSYLGANVDAFAEAGSMGIAADASSGYTPDSAGVKNAFVAMSANLSSYRATPTARAMTLTDEQRKKMGGKAAS